MTKHEFLTELRRRLTGLPQKEIDSSIDYYGEMIDDRMEEGISEEEAVAAIGTPAQAAAQVLSDTPLSALVKNRVRPSRALRVWEIVLLILGSPIWLSLLVAVFAVVFSAYAVLWVAIVVLHAAEVTVGACALFGLFYPMLFFVEGNVGAGLAYLGAGLILAGLTILLFYVCYHATRGLCLLTKKIFLGIKTWFIRKEAKE